MILRRAALVRIDVSEEIIASIVFLRSVFRLPVTTNAILISQILAALMMEAICSSETSFPTRVTWHNISILHSHRRENLKSYIALTG
jgi:hypothetical protein